MSDIIFIGCDPGVIGAVAAIDEKRNVHICEDFPLTITLKAPRTRRMKNKQGKYEKKTVRGKTREYDFVSMAELFNKILVLHGRKLALVEKVSSMPRDAKAAAFTFGGSYWAIRQALADRGIPFALVSPKKWQTETLTNRPVGDRKAIRASYLAKARILFPKVDLHLKKHAEKAAALMIAEYCRRNYLRK